MKKLLAVAVLHASLSGLVAHAAGNCRDFDLTGTWQNGWGVQFQIEQPNCDELILRDVSHGNTPYRIKLNGHSEAVIKGERILNAPALVHWFYDRQGASQEVRMPLLRDLRVTGKLVDSPALRPGEFSNAGKKVAKLHVVADFALPVTGHPGKFYSLRGSAEATITGYQDGSTPSVTDAISANLTHVRIEALETHREPPMPMSHRAFIAGMNAILGLYDIGSSDQNSAMHLDGSQPFSSLIDWQSLILTPSDEQSQPSQAPSPAK